MIFMERKIFICLIFSLGQIFGQSSHLLLVSQGDGAEVSKPGEEKVALAKASFLPNDEEIAVLSKSGLETMMAGATFRFGENTAFRLSDESIILDSGSMMIQSRKIQNIVNIKSQNFSTTLSGAGTCLLEVEKSGGFKIVGVLGRFKMKCDSKDSSSAELMPGGLIALKSGNSGFSKSTNINLSKLIETSYLLSGFPNSSTFQNSLASIARQQSNAIGSSTISDNDENGISVNFDNPAKDAEDSEDDRASSIVSEDEGYVIPEDDPLSELLGRAPRKFGETLAVPLSAEASKELELLSSQNNQAPAANKKGEQGPRPFPSRLLRKSKVQK